MSLLTLDAEIMTDLRWPLAASRPRFHKASTSGMPNSPSSDVGDERMVVDNALRSLSLQTESSVIPDEGQTDGMCHYYFNYKVIVTVCRLGHGG
jgi:hypothetical protein